MAAMLLIRAARAVRSTAFSCAMLSYYDKIAADAFRLIMLFALFIYFTPPSMRADAAMPLRCRFRADTLDFRYYCFFRR